jgi:hypothetical protein
MKKLEDNNQKFENDINQSNNVDLRQETKIFVDFVDVVNKNISLGQIGILSTIIETLEKPQEEESRKNLNDHVKLKELYNTINVLKNNVTLEKNVIDYHSAIIRLNELIMDVRIYIVQVNKLRPFLQFELGDTSDIDNLDLFPNSLRSTVYYLNVLQSAQELQRTIKTQSNQIRS